MKRSTEGNSKINHLNKQEQHWENMFSNRPEMFGDDPSVAAIKSVETFKKEKLTNILELGGGQGRDSLFFAQSNFTVQVLDYSQSGVDSITKQANILGLAQSITVKKHDIRKPLPFKDESFDGCFSHMLFCMAFTTKELKSISNEIHRVLNTSGINIYTVRHTEDADYGNGIHRGEDLYEIGGFIVHYFSREKIKQLSAGFNILSIESFEEGPLPRKLFQVTLKKQ